MSVCVRTCVYVGVDCGEVVCLTIVVDRTLLVNTGDATSDIVSTAHYTVCFTAFEVRVVGHQPSGHSLQWRKSGGKFFLGDDTACGPNCESLIHKIGHDKTSDTVEDDLY